MNKYVVLVVILLFSLYFIYRFGLKPVHKKEVGDKIPSFSLKDQNGNTVHISEKTGKPMVIYFYPKDDTPGCIKEACAFRDAYERFNDLDVLVFGISSDSVESHKRFEEKYQLPFTLLADINKKVRRLFGVPKSLLFFPGRVTFIIDEKGIIKYIFNSQFNIENHIKLALEHLTGKKKQALNN